MMWHKAQSVSCYLGARVKYPIVVAHILRIAIILVAPILVASSASVAAQDIGNANAGREYAVRHCASCHAIDGNDMHSPNSRATPFAQIARTPGMNARALTVWLRSVHKDMPDLIIENNDINNLLEYILSLAPDQRVKLGN